MPDRPNRNSGSGPSEHSEAYWRAIKYIILGLTAVMVMALALAIAIALRAVPWS